MNQIPYWEDEDDRRYRSWVNSFKPKPTPIETEVINLDANSIYHLDATITFGESEE